MKQKFTGIGVFSVRARHPAVETRAEWDSEAGRFARQPAAPAA